MNHKQWQLQIQFRFRTRSSFSGANVIYARINSWGEWNGRNLIRWMKANFSWRYPWCYAFLVWIQCADMTCVVNFRLPGNRAGVRKQTQHGANFAVCCFWAAAQFSGRWFSMKVKMLGIYAIRIVSVFLRLFYCEISNTE